MSGGRFEYIQYRIDAVASDIQQELERQGTLKPKSELYCPRDYYEDHPEELLFETHAEDIQQHMKDAIVCIKKAVAYIHAIDYYLSGDYGDDSFRKQLKAELSKIKRKYEKNVYGSAGVAKSRIQKKK